MNTGAFGENFPYSNFHDLNMDWIIKITKDFLDQYTNIQTTIADGLTSLQETTETGLTSIEEETTAKLAELNDEYERLNGLLDTWYETHSSDIADELASALAEFDEHVREVIESLPDYTELAKTVDIMEDCFLYTSNMAGSLIPNYFINYNDGTAAPFQDETFFVTDYINVIPGSKLFIANYRPEVQTADLAGIAFYDVSGTFISGVQYQYPNNPIKMTVPNNSAYMRASYFSNINRPLIIYSSQYTNEEISLTGVIQAFNSTPFAPYNDANTIPIGTICTYIGVQNFPSHLPTYLPTYENVITIVTMNYRKTSRGGSVQYIYGASSSFVRYADNESTYGEWRKNEFSGRVINTQDKYISPWNDCDTLPQQTVVTYIGYALMPSHCPDITENVATVITLNYSHNSLGGSVQLWFDAGSSWYRYSWSESEYRTWTPLGTNIHVESAFALFPNIGLIGDSYCMGTLTLGESGDGEYPAISWGKIVEREYGITSYLFAKGGLTTRTWLTDANGLTAMQNAPALDLYILALGINDDALLGTSYIGDVSDIGTSADTFYGNYSRIITAIQTKAPYAKIVISTIATLSPGDHPTEFNTAINNIATHYGIPVLVQDDDVYFNSEQYSKDMINNHPVGSGYAHMANAFDRMLCKALDTHKNYFKDFGEHTNWVSLQDQLNNVSNKQARILSMTLPSTADVFNVALNRATDFVISIHVKNASGDWLDNNYTVASDGKPIVTVLHSGYMRLNFADYVSKDMKILYIRM